MESYKASLDTLSKIITGFVFLLSVFGVVVAIVIKPWYGGLGLIVIPVVILIPTYIYSVKSYQITNEKLIIKRPLSGFDKEIPLSKIESVTLPPKEDFKWTVRTAGNGGLFGYTGNFANAKLGNFKLYATNRENRILIILRENQNKIVLSPDDAGMAEALQKHLGKQA
jgi:hypothetical protein